MRPRVQSDDTAPRRIAREPSQSSVDLPPRRIVRQQSQTSDEPAPRRITRQQSHTSAEPVPRRIIRQQSHTGAEPAPTDCNSRRRHSTRHAPMDAAVERVTRTRRSPDSTLVCPSSVASQDVHDQRMLPRKRRHNSATAFDRAPRRNVTARTDRATTPERDSQHNTPATVARATAPRRHTIQALDNAIGVAQDAISDVTPHGDSPRSASALLEPPRLLQSGAGELQSLRLACETISHGCVSSTVRSAFAPLHHHRPNEKRRWRCNTQFKC